jgi:hypoxanthine phosphoribosyltransferase
VTQLLSTTPQEEDLPQLEDGAMCRLWRSFRGRREPRFVNESERECAELLDYYGIEWEYEPVMFVLETDPSDGRVTEAFRPDFYLPELNLFLEVTTMKQELVTRKNRKVRKLRQRYPDVNVRLFYRRDIEALGQKLRSRAAS